MHNIAALLPRESLGDYVSFIETSIMSAIAGSGNNRSTDLIIENSVILDMAISSFVGTLDLLIISGFAVTEAVLAVILRIFEKMVNILKGQSDSMRKSRGNYY
jgi:hypothetical protein